MASRSDGEVHGLEVPVHIDLNLAGVRADKVVALPLLSIKALPFQVLFGDIRILCECLHQYVQLEALIDGPLEAVSDQAIVDLTESERGDVKIRCLQDLLSEGREHGQHAVLNDRVVKCVGHLLDLRDVQVSLQQGQQQCDELGLELTDLLDILLAVTEAQGDELIWLLKTCDEVTTRVYDLR